MAKKSTNGCIPAWRWHRSLKGSPWFFCALEPMPGTRTWLALLHRFRDPRSSQLHPLALFPENPSGPSPPRPLVHLLRRPGGSRPHRSCCRGWIPPSSSSRRDLSRFRGRRNVGGEGGGRNASEIGWTSSADGAISFARTRLCYGLDSRRGSHL